jgi:hypothetical protein
MNSSPVGDYPLSAGLSPLSSSRGLSTISSKQQSRGVSHPNQRTSGPAVVRLRLPFVASLLLFRAELFQGMETRNEFQFA